MRASARSSAMRSKPTRSRRRPRATATRPRCPTPQPTSRTGVLTSPSQSSTRSRTPSSHLLSTERSSTYMAWACRCASRSSATSRARSCSSTRQPYPWALLEHQRLALSVVVPIFNERESIPILHERLQKTLGDLDVASDIIYVDDGSTDGSAEVLRSLTTTTCTRVIRFRRNFGQTAAVQAGIEHSAGEVLVFLDGDLQNDPADIPRLLDQLALGNDVVSGWRQDRQDKWLSRRLPSQVANWLISLVTGVPLKDYGCTLKAYRREVLENAHLYGELHRFVPDIASWPRPEVTVIRVEHHARHFGASKYRVSRTCPVPL